MKEFTSVISSQCEVTLPEEVRRALGVELGDAVCFTIDDGKVSLSPASKNLEAENKAQDVIAAKPPFRVKPNNSGFVEGIDTVRLNQLLADFDTEEYLASKEADISPSPDAMSLEAAYGSVKPMNRPEDFNEITAIAKQAKAEKTAQELNDAWTS